MLGCGRGFQTKNMEKYQERMLAELKELNDKTVKLDAFFDTDTYNNLDEHRRVLLMLQKNAMTQYAVILAFRCKAEGISEEEILKL